MINISYLVPLLLIVLIISFVAIFIAIGKITFYSENKRNFMFRNHFPFELYYQRNIAKITYFRIILIILFGLLLASSVIFATSFVGNNSNLAFAITISIFFIIGDVASFMLFMIGPILLRQFKIYVTIMFSANVLNNAIFAILSFNSIFKGYAHKILGGFAIALAFTNILIMINPKLKDWSKLESINNKDGTISYIRPKISYLALSMWISFLTLLLGTILMLLSITFTSLNI